MSFSFKKPKQVSWEYDEGADVLYISFGKPKKALSIDLGSGIVARYLETHRNERISGAQKSSKKISRETKEVVGFTIIGLKRVLKSAK